MTSLLSTNRAPWVRGARLGKRKPAAWQTILDIPLKCYYIIEQANGVRI
jgi:hypothetical protein